VDIVNTVEHNTANLNAKISKSLDRVVRVYIEVYFRSGH